MKELFRKENIGYCGIIFAITAFMLTCITSCTEGGTLEITNGHQLLTAHVSAWFEDDEMVTKDIAPGETKTWSFSKTGTVYYGYSFDDGSTDTKSMIAKSFTVMGGEVTRITIAQ
jgi:hypothetical protein